MCIGKGMGGRVLARNTGMCVCGPGGGKMASDAYFPFLLRGMSSDLILRMQIQAYQIQCKHLAHSFYLLIFEIQSRQSAFTCYSVQFTPSSPPFTKKKKNSLES